MEFPYWGLGHEKNGIVHVVGPEYGITLPGATIVCGDSHTSTHGAFGADSIWNRNFRSRNGSYLLNVLCNQSQKK